MRAAIPPLPQYAYMAWCLVKHRDKFTFTFIPPASCLIVVKVKGRVIIPLNLVQRHYLIKHHDMKMYWGSGGVPLRILNLTTRWC